MRASAGERAESRLGEVSGEEMVEDSLLREGWRGRICSRWLLSSACCSWRSRYFCMAKPWLCCFVDVIVAEQGLCVRDWNSKRSYDLLDHRMGDLFGEECRKEVTMSVCKGGRL